VRPAGSAPALAGRQLPLVIPSRRRTIHAAYGSCCESLLALPMMLLATAAAATTATARSDPTASAFITRLVVVVAAQQHTDTREGRGADSSRGRERLQQAGRSADAHTTAEAEAGEMQRSVCVCVWE
jgi:hypothetical protein